MPTDRAGDPWAGATYKGFSDAAGAPPRPPRRAPRGARGAAPILIVGGVAAALALGAGVGVGFWVRPQLWPGPAASPAATADRTPPPAARPAPPTATADMPTTTNPPLQIPLAPRAPGRLESLPPEMTVATQAAARPRARPRPQSPQSAPDDTAPAPPPGDGTLQGQLDALLKAQSSPAPPKAPSGPSSGPSSVQVAALPPVATRAPEAVAHGRASFDCATARPGAEQLVCSDPQLAADDRQMARAYGRAMRAGINPASLSREQQDWVAIREDAAHRSRRAVAQVYDQRIRELDRMAAGPAADDDSDDDGE
jgi:uncharacterized protein YecT (DUF1311 family)